MKLRFYFIFRSPNFVLMHRFLLRWIDCARLPYKLLLVLKDSNGAN